MSSNDRYWCHRCHNLVSLTEGPDPVCPSCLDGFLEMLEDGYPGTHSLPPPLLFANYLARNNIHTSRSPAARRDFWAAMRRPSRLSRYDHSPGPGHASSLQLLELMSFLSFPSRPNEEIRREIEDAMLSGFLQRRGFLFDDESEDGRRHRRDLDAREFLLGSGLETLILHSQDGFGDAGRHGSSVRASEAAVNAMPAFKFKKQRGQLDSVNCAVCKEAFEAGGEVREMPCKHIYHSGCILPWLALHRSCPICRYEMPAEESLPGVASSSSEGIIAGRGRFEGGRGSGVALIGHVGGGMNVRTLTLWGLGSNRPNNSLPTSDVEGVDSTVGPEVRYSTSSDVSTGHDPERLMGVTPVCTTDLAVQGNVPAPNGQAPRTGSNPGDCGWGNRFRNWISRHGRQSASTSIVGSRTDSRPSHAVRRQWL